MTIRRSKPYTTSRIGTIVTLCSLAVLLLTLGLRVSSSVRSPHASGLRLKRQTAVAISGEFRKTLRVSGTVEGIDYAEIHAPKLRGPLDFRWTPLTIVRLLDTGSFVSAGSVVARFEVRSLQDHIEDYLSYVKILKSSLKKIRAEISILREADSQRILEAEKLYEKSLINLRLRSVLSTIDAENLKIFSDTRQAILQQTQKEAHMAEASYTATLRSSMLNIRKHVLHVARHQRDYDDLVIKAPIGGMLVREIMLTRSGHFVQVKEGDRLYPGMQFIRIIDMSRMVVSALINQVDLQAIHIGDRALIGFDSYPEISLSGRVVSLAPIVSHSSARLHVRHVPAKILIEGSDERIVPNLSASVELQLSSAWGILVPREALQKDSGIGSDTYVYVVRGDEYYRRRVVVEDTSDTQALIQSGIEPGDEVLLNEFP